MHIIASLYVLVKIYRGAKEISTQALKIGNYFEVTWNISVGEVTLAAKHVHISESTLP
jgi:UDP-3-O-[3-hydroxymyristoyl] glucosamine N-acyltransferase